MSPNKKVTSPTIMKRNFKQSWSAIPPISTKRTIASHLMSTYDGQTEGHGETSISPTTSLWGIIKVKYRDTYNSSRRVLDSSFVFGTRQFLHNLFQLFSQGTSGTEIVFVHYCYFIVRTKENII
jgi:hypothetical protein